MALNLDGKNRELVGLGSYLVNAGGCNGDFGQISEPPSPHIISRNLTPSTKTGLPEGDHTFQEFLEIFRTGKVLTTFIQIVRRS